MRATEMTDHNLDRAALEKAVAWLASGQGDSLLTASEIAGARQFFELAKRFEVRPTALATAIEMCLTETPLVALLYEMSPPEDGDYLGVSARISQKLNDGRFAKIIHAFAGGVGRQEE